ncbi:MAG: sulfatase-like hydrolase/transferase [Planctomycetota bacterium]
MDTAPLSSHSIRRTAGWPRLPGLALLAAAIAAPGCGEGDQAAAPREALAPEDRKVTFFERGAVINPIRRDAEVLGEYRIPPGPHKDTKFRVHSRQGRMFQHRSRTGSVTSRFWGERTTSGESMIKISVADLGGEEALKRLTGVEMGALLPGASALQLTAVFLDPEDRVLGRSTPVNGVRSPKPQRLRFQVKPGVQLTGATSVALKVQGKEGIVALADLRLVRHERGASLPDLRTPQPFAFGSEVRMASGLVEGHPWEGEFLIQPDSYLRVSLHSPATFRVGSDVPQLTVDALDHDGSLLATERIKIPQENVQRWHDARIPLDVGGAESVRLRLSATTRREEQGLLLVGEATVHAPVRDPRTVLLITSDTHRGDYLGLARGGIEINTPVLDALARRGAYFEDCQTTINTTTASHVSIMTGVHPRDTQIVDNFTRVSTDAFTLAEAFAGAGFRTLAAVSIGHLTPSRSGLGQGFDRFYNPIRANQRATVAVEKLSGWIEDSSGEDLFAWLHVFDAHSPYDPPSKKSQVSPDQPPLQIDPSMIGWSKVPRWLQTTDATSLVEIKGWYGDEVESVDSFLQPILHLPRVQQGWIALTSDHGENLGENGSWFKHSGLFLPVLQVPLAIAGPGVDPMRTRAQVQHLSIGRTLLDLAGVQVAFPGRNLLDASSMQDTDEARFAISTYGHQASITLGRWLLVLGLKTVKELGEDPFYLAGRVRLFDRTKGYSTEQDFVELEPEIARAMRARLIRWLEETGDLGPLAEDASVTEAQREELHELGYSGGPGERNSKWWFPERVIDPKWRAAF